MRYKLEQYRGKEKHRFTAQMVKYGSYRNKSTGENHNTILFKDVKNEKGEILTDHAWVKEDSYTKNIKLEKGKIYSFEAGVGVYNRGKTSKDYQLRKVRQITVA